MTRILAALLCLLGIGCSTAGAAPQPWTNTIPAEGVLWGAMVDGDAYGPSFDDPPWDMDAQTVFEGAGKRASLIHYGQSWAQGGVMQPFYPVPAQAIEDRGAVALLDWNPWDGQAGGGAGQPSYQLRDIIRGRFDSYIRSWARGARDWGFPIMVRPMHEMNGTWYPWSERANGNRAGEFVKAWRRIHGLVRGQGATNVAFVWSPNVVYTGSIPLAGLYPGAAYVDWVGADGYAWTGSSETFIGVFWGTYQQITALAPGKPFVVAETGKAEDAAKPAWITDALATVAARQTFPAIRALAWFNVDASGEQWRIESSPAAAAAFHAGVAAPGFVGG